MTVEKPWIIKEFLSYKQGCECYQRVYLYHYCWLSLNFTTGFSFELELDGSICRGSLFCIARLIRASGLLVRKNLITQSYHQISWRELLFDLQAIELLCFSWHPSAGRTDRVSSEIASKTTVRAIDIDCGAIRLLCHDASWILPYHNTICGMISLIETTLETLYGLQKWRVISFTDMPSSSFSEKAAHALYISNTPKDTWIYWIRNISNTPKTFYTNRLSSHSIHPHKGPATIRTVNMWFGIFS